MSAQYRTERAKLIAKYCRKFGVTPELVKLGHLTVGKSTEEVVYCPTRSDLPWWGMGSNSEDWQDGPTQDKPRWATRPPKTVMVSRRKR